MTDAQVEKIIKTNMSFQMNIPGILTDFEEALRKPWVGLTPEECNFLAELQSASPTAIVRLTEAKLREKNT